MKGKRSYTLLSLELTKRRLWAFLEETGIEIVFYLLDKLQVDSEAVPSDDGRDRI